MSKDDQDTNFIKTALYGAGAISLIAIIYSIYLNPLLCIWTERQAGLAELARAESNRQIKVCEAMAFKESAKSLAEAEIIRAHGVAESNKIIGQSLAENEQYLRYLWIQTLQSSNKEVIYIPTEANLPILEANRLKDNK